VLARAAHDLGPAPVLELLGPTDPRCCRAAASHRLHIRRWAARRQRGGESWSYLDTLHLIDAELARMKASAEEASGCRTCIVCRPPECGSCGGHACAAGGRRDILEVSP
jgi:hypothetical protein